VIPHRTRKLPRLLVDIALLAALIVPGAAGAEILAAPPDRPDPARMYLVYSHGQIVEGSDGRPVSAEFGPYEYAEILERLSREGFVVISGVRAANAELEEEARKLQVQVRALLDAGVPANHVVVVGVSKGGMIAIRAAHLLANREIRYVILSSFFAPYATRADYLPYGEILSIQDASDGLELRPERFLDDPARVPKKRILVTHTGRGHGLGYTPNDEWVVPLVEWSGIAATRGAAERAPERDGPASSASPAP